MVEWGWIILYRCALMGRFYEFTHRAAKLMVSGGDIFRCSFFTNLSTKPTVSDGNIFRCTFFTNLSTKPTVSGGDIFRCTFFTNLSTKPTVSGGDIFLFMFLPAALLDQRPPVAPSFAARRKIEEKGVPRGLRSP